MGKKSKKNKATTNKLQSGDDKSGDAVAARETMPRQAKRETTELVSQLFEKCSCPLGVGAQEWTDFLDIYKLIEKIRVVQKDFALQHTNREKHFNEFVSWLRENGVDTSSVAIEKFDEGHGLKATKDIEMAQLVLEIPRRLMMTTETAAESCLKLMIQEDRILQAMPNIVMALHVLCEKMTNDSFWKPYLDVLPETYTTPLYFTSEELQLLKGSPAQSDMLNQFRNIARQYAYFFKLFHSSPHAAKLPLKDFCYEDYRWAVATVMTRQNQIPSSHSDTAITALIPLWDMCNHCNGQLSTDFNVPRDASQCFAFRPFLKGEQVFIFYGSRSNAELLIHNGFVYLPSRCDRMSLKLGISKNDPLCDKKAEVLAKMNVLPSRTFFLYNTDEPAESELLAFLRVFNMTEEELNARITGANAKELHRNLRDFMDLVSEENEIKAWNFLVTRLSLLLRTYEDVEEVTPSTPTCRALAINLLISERRILSKVKDYCEKRVEKVKTKQNLAPLSMPVAEQVDIETLEEEGDDETEELEEIKKIQQSPAAVKQMPAPEETDHELDGQIENGIEDVSEDVDDIKLAE